MSHFILINRIMQTRNSCNIRAFAGIKGKKSAFFVGTWGQRDSARVSLRLMRFTNVVHNANQRSFFDEARQGRIVSI